MKTLRFLTIMLPGVIAAAPLAPPVTPAPAIPEIIQKQTGTWKLNLEESRNTEGLPYKSGFTVIVRSGYPIQDYTFIADPVGNEKPYTFSFKGEPDGKVRPNGTDGATYSMELLPDGIVDAKLWSKNGDYENKFCIPYASMRKIICLATVTTKSGRRTMFTNVLDKISDATN